MVAGRVVYLPIETKSRELDSKVLMAVDLINHGLNVVICGKKFDLENSSKGLVVLKSAAAFEYERINRLKKIGMKCVVLDEEGLVHTSNEREHALRYSQKTLDMVDMVYFHGNYERDLIARNYHIDQKKYSITGNPRFDLYKSEYSGFYSPEADLIKKKYGKFVLIPSRFAMINIAKRGVESEKAYIEFLKKNYVSNENELKTFIGMMAHAKSLFNAFLELIPKLSKKFPDINFVIRPHPSEASGAWLEASRSCNNVFVTNDGAIGPWLLSAVAIIHNGCTTGFEAYLAGKAVISYMPFTSEEYDLKLPNVVSRQTYNEGELFQALDSALNDSGRYDSETIADLVQNYLVNAKRGLDAFSNICHLIQQLSYSLPVINKSDLVVSRWITLRKQVSKRTALLISDFFNLIKCSPPVRYRDVLYSYRKNPGISREDIASRVELVRRNILRDSVNIKIKKIDEDAYLLFR